jgi:hypothetical protein
MPTPRKSDDPNALTEHLGIMVTKAELARVMAVSKSLGVSKSAAARIVLREGFETPRVKSFTPQETTDES